MLYRKLMSERLLEFNRIALKKHLEVDSDKNKLVEDLKQLLEHKYPHSRRWITATPKRLHRKHSQVVSGSHF
nr:unnamed protein product [Callosobruchus chinensis]